MNMSELKIVATIELKAEYEKELLDALHTIVIATRKEEGNISYDMHQNIKEPLKYTFLEVWKDQDSIDKHNASTHFQTFVAAIKGKIVGLTVDIVKKVY